LLENEKSEVNMFGFGRKKVADNVLKVVTTMRMLFSYLESVGERPNADMAELIIKRYVKNEGLKWKDEESEIGILMMMIASGTAEQDHALRLEHNFTDGVALKLCRILDV